jgi:SagB-type dehydrogenase family enzyme
MTSVRGSEPWYLAEGKQAQWLLEQGRSREAVQRFEAVLAGFGTEASYGRALILERLGRALLQVGRHDDAIGRIREALELAGRLAPTGTVQRLRCTLRSDLGDALRSAARPAEARRAYLAALAIGKELSDPRSQGVDEARLGALAVAVGDLTEAREHYRRSLSQLEQLREPDLEAAAWHQLGEVLRQLGEWEEAEQACRKAIEKAPNARRLLTLAELLLRQRGRIAEAGRIAEQALALAQNAEPTAGEGWQAYGLLAEIHEALAAEGQPAAHPARVAGFREVARRAPAILAAARQLGSAPSLGRAVILGRLGRCFCIGGRADLGAAHMREALAVAGQLPNTTATSELRAMLEAELAAAMGTRGVVEREAPAPLPEVNASALEVFLLEEMETDYAFDPDLLLDGPRTRSLRRCDDLIEAVPENAGPVLAPATRTWLDPDGWIRFHGSVEEPRIHYEGGCTLIRRSRRELAIGGATGSVWAMLGAMNGRSTAAEILAGLPDRDREHAALALRSLITAGMVDLSGRAIGRFVHWSTRKSVLAAGGLDQEEVLRLATDGQHRAHADLPRIPLGGGMPERLRAFHDLTRRRRSRRDYQGAPITREEFDALLGTACGVTGALQWQGREVKLRAYPSSGALYAVGVYPVPFRVEGLTPGVYHFDADENAIQPVGVPLDVGRFVQAALPMERQMVSGSAAMFCLTGFFPRHERKYGEGGYRMLVAEAGHVSQSLVLAATALGLHARPFGGVFDGMINEALGLNEAEEQFLLAVLVGR